MSQTTILSMGESIYKVNLFRIFKIQISRDLAACRDYDVTVMEDRERAGQEGEPRVPPRGRANPFNSGTEVARKKQRRSWAELHGQLGERVRRDRDGWAGRRVEGVHMEEENLLVVF